jgi:hypothetical protein
MAIGSPLMAQYDALELRIIDQARPEYIRPRDGVSVDEELVHFLRRTHAYELGWVKVEAAKYIRYERIASVEIKRGLDDGN